jgi:transposase
MANKLLGMHNIRQILLFLERGASQRTIEKEVKINRRTVATYLEKFSQTGFCFKELLTFNDKDLEQYLGLTKAVVPEDTDPRKIHFDSLTDYFRSELKRIGVTRLLLWQEYIREYPAGFQYSRFCELLQHCNKVNNAVMHFDHQPGEMLQVDFAGDELQYVESSTGEVIKCPVFVAVLPFSGYAYVEALSNAKLPQVVSALNHTLEYFGGVPKAAKSDNMRQWVSKSNRYEPVFTEMLEQWANHNHIALLAARPYKPKDKPSVENTVKIVYQRIYALLRNQVFLSLPSLNQAIKERLADHHSLNFQRKAFSRQELFKQEKSTLQSLPSSPYSIRHYTKAKVQKNYHVVVGEDWHFYSVPYRYIGKEVRISYCQDTVEIYDQATRIAIHNRSYKKHGYTTIKEHMPAAHQQVKVQGGWDPDYYLKKAAECGPSTTVYFKKVMEGKLIIDQAYTACQGLLRLATTYGSHRIEAACTRALRGHKFTYVAIRNILENNMDLLECTSASTEYRIPAHDNVRGPEAYLENQ